MKTLITPASLCDIGDLYILRDYIIQQSDDAAARSLLEMGIQTQIDALYDVNSAINYARRCAEESTHLVKKMVDGYVCDTTTVDSYAQRLAALVMTAKASRGMAAACFHNVPAAVMELAVVEVDVDANEPTAAISECRKFFVADGCNNDTQYVEVVPNTVDGTMKLRGLVCNVRYALRGLGYADEVKNLKFERTN